MKAHPLLLAMLLVAGALTVAAPIPAAAATVVKLATLVPEGSVWDKALREMGTEWNAGTGGEVTLRIYPGGVAGDEPDVLRKMRIGQLHAATLTVAGLADIDDGFRIFQIPLFFDSYDELYYVLDRLEPALEKRLAAKGFVLLHWGHAGWVHFFSKEPMKTVEDLKKLKLFTSAGDDRQVQWWKANGFQPVALATTDILTGLQTGMVEALPTPPLAALSLQWYRLTPYMLDLGFAPLVGATIITQRAWNSISEDDREKILAAARRAEGKLEKEIPQQDRRAIASMKERGLTVVEVAGTPHEAGWRQGAETFADTVRGELVPPEILDLALTARAKYREQSAN